MQEHFSELTEKKKETIEKELQGKEKRQESLAGQKLEPGIRTVEGQQMSGEETTKKAAEKMNATLRMVEKNLPESLTKGHFPRSFDNALQALVEDDRSASRSRFKKVRSAAKRLVKAAGKPGEEAEALGNLFRQCMHYLKNFLWT